MFKLILVETDSCDCDDYGQGCCESEITTREITLGELADTKQDELKQGLVAALTRLLEAKDKQTIDALKQAGWVNKDGIKDRVEKLEAGKKFIYSDARYGYRGISEFDLDSMSHGTAMSLAEEKVQVYQQVTKTSLKKLMTSENRKSYESESKRLRAEKEKKAVSAKKRRETLKAKKIAAAKKLLEEAGEK